MKDWQGKTYWLVGASEGLGRALAQKLSAVGCRLILSARSEDRLTELVGALPGTARAVTCDVTDAGSVARAAEDAAEADGVVMLAGTYWPMAADDWDAQKALTMAEVNFLGTLRVMGEVVPRMVARGRGHVVLTGSLSGFRGLPNSIGYAASKAGVMVLAEGMHADLRGSGVEVQLVNPGFIRTRLTEKNDFQMPQRMEPSEAAQAMFDHMNTDAFSKSFPFPLAAILRGSNALPEALYYRIFS